MDFLLKSPTKGKDFSDYGMESGTLKEVIKFLISKKISGKDARDMTAHFLACYKKYCTPAELISILSDMCSKENERFPLLVKTWVDQYFVRDFCSFKKKRTTALYSALLSVLEKMGNVFGGEANQIKLTILREYKLELMSKLLKGSEKPEVISHAKSSFSTLNSKEIARHLTVFEFNIFRTIDRSEFYSKMWTREDRMITAPNINNMIETSNKVSMWIASLVLNQKSAERRARIAQKIIMIAHWCKKFNNFNSVMEIMGGLTMWCVQRILKEGKLPQKFTVLHSYLTHCVEPRNNYHHYRNLLKKVKGKPCLPYLGVFLRDLTFMEDGNPDLIEGKLNLKKISMVGEQLHKIHTFQSNNYKTLYTNTSRGFLKYLAHLPYYAEEKLEEVSLSIMPEQFAIPLKSAASSRDGSQDGGSQGSGTESGSEDFELESMDNCSMTSIEETFDELPESHESDNKLYDSYFGGDC